MNPLSELGSDLLVKQFLRDLEYKHATVASSRIALQDLEGIWRFLHRRFRCVSCWKEGAYPKGANVSYCARCGRHFCELHWDLRHDDDPENPEDIHERTEPELAELLKETFPAANRPKEDLPTLTEKDATSLWFGVIPGAEMWSFEERTTYEELVLSTPKTPSAVFPGLVSFVGQTGDGKSSLISLLIKLASLFPLIPGRIDDYLVRQRHSIPIIGTPGDSYPTSAHVHLYLDPQTSETTNPILFADCEGLDGGEKDPRTLISRPQVAIHGETKPGGDFRHCPKKDIPWTRAPSKNNTRRFMVKKFYPRILYTFSDVVVFVLGNSRRHEDAIQRLADWAFDVIQSSTNQAVLPHAILVLNKSEISISSDLWETTPATEDLFKAELDAFFKLPDLQKHVKLWRDRYSKSPEDIPTATELLLSYYASVKVVHIPPWQYRMKLFEKQITKLYREISYAHQKSYERREGLQMKLNAENFMLFMQKAFDHFIADFTVPFNFVQAWFDINQESTASDFPKGILSLALAAQRDTGLEGVHVWRHISEMVASCIALSARQQELPLADVENVFRAYWRLCYEALKSFYDRHWQCEFSDETKDLSSTSYGRCVNVRNTHEAKGHQNKAGKLRDGKHRASYTLEGLRDDFKGRVHEKFQKLFKERDIGKDQAWKVHQEIMNAFYDKKGQGDDTKKEDGAFKSSSTCFSCLCDIPEHSLPCGHILCVRCIAAAGSPHGSGFIELEGCPLMGCKGDAWGGNNSWLISTKPPQAGVRILTLDGGGVRGLVELEILRRLEDELSCGIPIHAFFDLIVGTSAGGLIALGLAHNWSIEKCNEVFNDFFRQAFSVRSPEWLGLFRHLVSYKNRGRYAVGPLEDALATAFPREPLFGGRLNLETEPTKVAVTSTIANSPDSQVAVLSNYNRKSHTTELYDFFRPEHPQDDLTVNQMARATSAAPTYFKEFKHDSSQQIYLDGGIYHNNPIKIANAERKIIWSRSKKKTPEISHPDIFVSVGTGFAQADVNTTLAATTTLERGPLAYFHTLLKIGSDYIKNGLACERAWMDWIETVDPDPSHLNRYRRLNVLFDVEPAMDVTDEETIEKYITQTRDEMDKKREVLKEIAAQMIGSCFFFHFEPGDDWNRETTTDKSCFGTIECRFPPKKDNIKKLGKYFQDLRNRSDKIPFFVIRETHQNPERPRWEYPIPPDDIDRMATDGTFKMPIPVVVSHELAETEILLSLVEDQKHATPISGFPRKLLRDYPGLVRSDAPGKLSVVDDMLIQTAYR